MGNRVIYTPAYEAEVEYLESDGNSFIDTGLKASSELGIFAHIQNSQNVKAMLFGGGDGIINKEFAFLGYSSDETSQYRFGTSYIENAKLDADIIYEFDNTQSHNIMKVGNLTYTAPDGTFESSFNLILFGVNRKDVPNKSTGVRIYDFKIYQNFTLVRDFIPVRIGNVGYMYDKVSKQLFANKGTGNFVLGNDVSNAVIPQQRCVLYFGSQRSVVYERVYEEYEWLVGDGSAYIDTNIKPSENLRTKIKFAYTDSSDSIARNSSIFGSGLIASGGIISNRYWVNCDNYLEVGYGNYYRTGWRISPNQDIEIDFNYGKNNTHKFKINDTIYPNWSGEPNTTQNIVIFGRNVGGTIYVSNSKVSYFQLIDSSNLIMNLIPVRLLRLIPAILDGNGIARQAGECGMWDKVSGRFYGNMSSGSFTVSNS